MPTINDWLIKDELKIQAGMEIHAAVRENFKDVKGGHKCKLCGEVVAHPRAAAAHLAVHHREALEAAEVDAGGPGSGRHKGGGMQCASEFASGGRILAYGTSEGVKKGWEVRDRRNITEYGIGMPGKGVKTTYGHPENSDHLYVTETARRAKVERHYTDEHGDNHITRIHEGTPKTASAFLKERYGIDHKKE